MNDIQQQRLYPEFTRSRWDWVQKLTVGPDGRGLTDMAVIAQNKQEFRERMDALNEDEDARNAFEGDGQTLFASARDVGFVCVCTYVCI